jgi:hypothetical protein
MLVYFVVARTRSSDIFGVKNGDFMSEKRKTRGGVTVVTATNVMRFAARKDRFYPKIYYGMSS